MFSDYNARLKGMRKIAHLALKAYGDGLVELESVLHKANALFKRFDGKEGGAFDPLNDLCKECYICSYDRFRSYTHTHTHLHTQTLNRMCSNDIHTHTHIHTHIHTCTQTHKY